MCAFEVLSQHWKLNKIPDPILCLLESRSQQHVDRAPVKVIFSKMEMDEIKFVLNNLYFNIGRTE